MRNCNYKFWIEDEVLIVEDIGGPLNKSVTNGIEEVFEEIGSYIDTTKYSGFVYRDSEKNWDFVTFDKGQTKFNIGKETIKETINLFKQNKK